MEITFYRVNDFQHLLREKATESNSSNNSNTAIRKQLILGTAAMTVMQIFSNSFQPSTPIVRKLVPVPRPLFKTPTPWPSLSPFLKSLFLLPSFLFHPLLRYFRQFPPPSRNPLCLLQPTNLPWLKQISKRLFYQFNCCFLSKINF